MTDSRSPADVVRAAAAAIEAEDWAGILPLVRSESIQDFRDSHLRMMLDSETRRPRTAEEVRAEQPWIPLEVAAYYAAEEHAVITRGLPHSRAQWGVSSFAELQELRPEEFLVPYLATSSMPARVRMALVVSQEKPPDEEALRAIEAGEYVRSRFVVLGEVYEGSRVAHVLYRHLYGDEPYEPEAAAGSIMVTTLDRVDGRWWLRIDHTLVNPQRWTFVRSLG